MSEFGQNQKKALLKLKLIYKNIENPKSIFGQGIVDRQ